MYSVLFISRVRVTMKLEKIRNCPTKTLLAINDTMVVINGKWKIPIIGTLRFGKKRFNDLERTISGITPRMLSKELKELEANSIVKRSVYNTVPITVEYELTASGESLGNLLDAIIEWGVQHRKNVVG